MRLGQRVRLGLLTGEKVSGNLVGATLDGSGRVVSVTLVKVHGLETWTDGVTYPQEAQLTLPTNTLTRAPNIENLAR